ncbi:MAG: zinc metalloprotease HtpX family protein [Acutalibacteraceae bacterium]
MEMFIGVLLAIPLGLIPAFIAKKKGHSFGLWWLYGWALFIVAIIHVMFIEDRTVTQSPNYYSNNSVSPAQYAPTPVPASTNKVEVNQAPKNSIGNVSEELRALKDLLDKEIISQDDFEAKKKQILGL